jgi:hypothetical protein
MASTITPPEIDETVRKFCLAISPENAPVYVEVVPHGVAKQDECFPNVRNIVRSKGGEIAYGWTIWIWPKVLVEAEHHAVWQKSDGTLVDITPKAHAEKQILFLPDPGRIYDFEMERRLDNVRRAIADNEEVRLYISLVARLDAFTEEHRVGRRNYVPPDKWDKYADLTSRIAACQSRISVFYG